MDDGYTVLNCTSPELMKQMDHPAAGLALRVKDPTRAAQDAVAYLRRQGFEATVLGELDPDVPAGAMVFVATDALPQIMLVFRKHVLKMGKRPVRWSLRATA